MMWFVSCDFLIVIGMLICFSMVFSCALSALKYFRDYGGSWVDIVCFLLWCLTSIGAFAVIIAVLVGAWK